MGGLLVVVGRGQDDQLGQGAGYLQRVVLVGAAAVGQQDDHPAPGPGGASCSPAALSAAASLAPLIEPDRSTTTAKAVCAFAHCTVVRSSGVTGRVGARRERGSHQLELALAPDYLFGHAVSARGR